MNDKTEMKKMDIFNIPSRRDEKQVAIEQSEKYSEDLKKRENELLRELKKLKEQFEIK